MPPVRDVGPRSHPQPKPAHHKATPKPAHHQAAPKHYSLPRNFRSDAASGDPRGPTKYVSPKSHETIDHWKHRDTFQRALKDAAKAGAQYRAEKKRAEAKPEKKKGGGLFGKIGNFVKNTVKGAVSDPVAIGKGIFNAHKRVAKGVGEIAHGHVLKGVNDVRHGINESRPDYQAAKHALGQAKDAGKHVVKGGARVGKGVSEYAHGHHKKGLHDISGGAVEGGVGAVRLAGAVSGKGGVAKVGLKEVASHLRGAAKRQLQDESIKATK